MKITDIAFIAYAVSDMKKSRAFYEGGAQSPSRTRNTTVLATQTGWNTTSLGDAGIGCALGCGSPRPKRFGGSRDRRFEQALETVKAKNISIVMGPHEFPSCRMVVIAEPRRKPHHFAQAQEEVSSSEPSFELRRFRPIRRSTGQDVHRHAQLLIMAADQNARTGGTSL